MAITYHCSVAYDWHRIHLTNCLITCKYRNGVISNDAVIMYRRSTAAIAVVVAVITIVIPRYGMTCKESDREPRDRSN
jgi:hypothetical protein